MNFGGMFIFLLIQVVVNYVLRILLADILTTLYGVIAYYLLSSLIISFIAALLNTPRQFRKDFYRHPGFHKTMLIYFAAFIAIDLIFLFI